jgi:hypothetical protein
LVYIYRGLNSWLWKPSNCIEKFNVIACSLVCCNSLNIKKTFVILNLSGSHNFLMISWLILMSFSRKIEMILRKSEEFRLKLANIWWGSVNFGWNLETIYFIYLFIVDAVKCFVILIKTVTFSKYNWITSWWIQLKFFIYLTINNCTRKDQKHSYL